MINWIESIEKAERMQAFLNERLGISQHLTKLEQENALRAEFPLANKIMTLEKKPYGELGEMRRWEEKIVRLEEGVKEIKSSWLAEVKERLQEELKKELLNKEKSTPKKQGKVGLEKIQIMVRIAKKILREERRAKLRKIEAIRRETHKLQSEIDNAKKLKTELGIDEIEKKIRDMRSLIQNKHEKLEPYETLLTKLRAQAVKSKEDLKVLAEPTGEVSASKAEAVSKKIKVLEEKITSLEKKIEPEKARVVELKRKATDLEKSIDSIVGREAEQLADFRKLRGQEEALLGELKSEYSYAKNSSLKIFENRKKILRAIQT